MREEWKEGEGRRGGTGEERERESLSKMSSQNY